MIKATSTDTGEFKDGDLIEVKHKSTPNLPARRVTYDNGGIRIGEHWFRWDYFFQVNFVVSQNPN